LRLSGAEIFEIERVTNSSIYAGDKATSKKMGFSPTEIEN